VATPCGYHSVINHREKATCHRKSEIGETIKNQAGSPSACAPQPQLNRESKCSTKSRQIDGQRTGAGDPLDRLCHHDRTTEVKVPHSWAGGRIQRGGVCAAGGNSNQTVSKPASQEMVSDFRFRFQWRSPRGGVKGRAHRHVCFIPEKMASQVAGQQRVPFGPAMASVCEECVFLRAMQVIRPRRTPARVVRAQVRAVPTRCNHRTRAD